MKSFIIFIIKYRITLLCLTNIWCANSIAEIGLLELPNYYEYSSTLASSGQPTIAQFKIIADAGIDYVVNLAPVYSPGAIPQEKEIVESLGMGYSHIPVNWDEPTISDLKQFLSIITTNSDKAILVHCWLNARASAFVYLSRVQAEGLGETSEYKVLESIWSVNPGFELKNVYHWQEFLSRAKHELQQ